MQKKIETMSGKPINLQDVELDSPKIERKPMRNPEILGLL
jgi:hypothetical protein